MHEFGLLYLTSVFMIGLISGCVINLLKQHYVIQLAGIAFLFTYSIFKSFYLLQNNAETSIRELYYAFLPSLTGIAACLVSMVLGFWIFPYIRKRIKG